MSGLVARLRCWLYGPDFEHYRRREQARAALRRITPSGLRVEQPDRGE